MDKHFRYSRGRIKVRNGMRRGGGERKEMKNQLELPSTRYFARCSASTTLPAPI